MNFFKRLFKIGQAEANASIDRMEDPIKMTEQGIRDMKDDLTKSTESLAQVKALSIRAKNEVQKHHDKAKDYEQKAIVILQKVKGGDIAADEADRLAKESLIKKDEAEKTAAEHQKAVDKYDKNLASIKKAMDDMKSNIAQWEGELKTLKARVKASDATKSVNKQMAGMDSSSTVDMLERMKEKVAQDEALAEAYEDLAKTTDDLDDQIAKAADTAGDQASNDLAQLKKSLGLDK